MSCCTAGVYNITCNQGATLSRTLTWADPAKNPINLTGYTARMQVRETAASNTVVLELTTSNTRITLGGTAGTVTINVNAATTTSLTPGKYVYDLEVVSGGGEVTRLVEGNFIVKAEVTR